MADKPTDNSAAAPHDAATLTREIRALLDTDAKHGLDEHAAKRLRKQWAAYCDAGGEDADLAALFAELRERIHAQVELRDKQYAQVEEQLRQRRAAAKGGDIAQARRIERAAIDALNRIAGLSDQRRQKVITELESLRPELHQLSAWRKWGTVQAREKMIAEIKTIHESGASLEKIARRIQQARKEWRAWEKAGESAPKRLQTEFERECSRAYQPCQAHFDAQKSQREQNSAAREQLCAALEEAFEAVEWRDPDWKQLNQLVRARRNDWRNAGPSDYKLRKPLQRRFDAIVEKFDERLERERRRNYKIREKLVGEVEQLAEREDTAAALSELSALKKDWVVTVTSKRRAEQALWKRFTEACDRVAANRRRERADFAKTLKQNLAERAALCAEIEACCDEPPESHSQIGARLPQWRTRWEQLGEAPKAEAAKIAKRYRNALARAQQAFAAAGAAAESRLQDLLREKMQVCADIEALALGDGDAAKAEALRARWEVFAALPDDELEAVSGARYQLACDALADDGARKQLCDAMPANLERLHEMLLQLEILAEVDSPAEFSRQRMALQIERLSAALGKGASESGGGSADQLIRDILLLGAVDADARVAAVARLERCLVALNSNRNQIKTTTKPVILER